MPCMCMLMYMYVYAHIIHRLHVIIKPQKYTYDDFILHLQIAYSSYICVTH